MTRRPAVMPRFANLFGALILVQAVHSVEEYVGRLWESFPPARFVSGLASSNHEAGFLTLNIALVTIGLWCFIWPVRRGWSIATTVAYVWIVVETINGVGHTLWAMYQGGYTPGLATAPLLLILAFLLARQVRRSRTGSLGAARP